MNSEIIAASIAFVVWCWLFAEVLVAWSKM
jgi:hypothetical protein